MSRLIQNSALTPIQYDPTWASEPAKLCNNKTAPDILQITEQTVVAQVKKYVVGSWPVIKDPNNFPGPQPISLERNDITKLMKYPYAVCEKTDGMRYLLVSLNIQGSSSSSYQSTFLVDRSFRVYTAGPGLWSCVSVFDGTILDGEVVRESSTGTYTYYPHDCIIRAGVATAGENFRERYEHSREVSVLWRKDDPTRNLVGILDLRFKRVYNIKNLAQLLEKGAEHDVDGLVFTPIGLPVQTGTQHSMIKWKEPTKHTFDFEVKINGQRADLYLYDSMSYTKYKTISKRTPIGKKFFSKFDALIAESKMTTLAIDETSNEPARKKYIIECVLEDKEYMPLKLRDDKNRPNSIRTIEKTLLNIEENITLMELIELAQQTKVPIMKHRFALS
mgnify:CR=1 FL=1